jgi:predicted nucleic acid-binding protein
MTVIADTGAIYALYDADDLHHQAMRTFVEAETRSLVIPSPVLPEVDYLLREYLGVDAELDFVDSLISGAFSVELVTAQDLKRCRELINQYRALDLGLVDSAVIAIAERLSATKILTVDLRDFRAVKPRHIAAFQLLPWDLET